MQREALYDNGRLILLGRELPAGTMKVTVNFPDEHLELSSEWQAEIDRRIEEIDSGAVEMIPAEEVFARLRKK